MTRGLIPNLIASIREEFGHPASLTRALAEYPHLRVPLDDPARSIAASSVPRWHELGEPHNAYSHAGQLMGWTGSGGMGWGSFQIFRPEYAQIAQHTVEDWSCDLRDVDGFSASKSDLTMFTSTDAMVERNSREMIAEISTAQLAKHLDHKEIRILHSKGGGGDYFTRYQWDGRLWLMNSGGSHHTAAAKYIAARLDHPVRLSGQLHTYRLNAGAIASLRGDFEMFALGDEILALNAFHEAMQAVRATWLWHALPKPYDNARVILLPRTDARSMRAAQAMRSAGLCDVGQHLMALAARQPRR